MQIQRAPEVHDVVVIGSGAAAGTKFNRAKCWTHVTPWDRREKTARGETPTRFYLDTKEQPYTTPENQPFELIRAWGRGGKTNVWGRVSLRYSDLDFASAEHDGCEIPEPIRYKDIAPYYDNVDQLIGVRGGGGYDDFDSLPAASIICSAEHTARRKAAPESWHAHGYSDSRPAAAP
jgi:choline dehydrogenase-like flavoprotein